MNYLSIWCLVLTVPLHCYNRQPLSCTTRPVSKRCIITSSIGHGDGDFFFAEPDFSVVKRKYEPGHYLQLGPVGKVL